MIIFSIYGKILWSLGNWWLNGIERESNWEILEKWDIYPTITNTMRNSLRCQQTWSFWENHLWIGHCPLTSLTIRGYDITVYVVKMVGFCNPTAGFLGFQLPFPFLASAKYHAPLPNLEIFSANSHCCREYHGNAHDVGTCFPMYLAMYLAVLVHLSFKRILSDIDVRTPHWFRRFLSASSGFCQCWDGFKLLSWTLMPHTDISLQRIRLKFQPIIWIHRCLKMLDISNWSNTTSTFSHIGPPMTTYI